MDIGILILLGVLATFAAGLGAYRTLDAAVGRRAANSLLLLALAVVLALTTIALIFAAVERPCVGLSTPASRSGRPRRAARGAHPHGPADLARIVNSLSLDPATDGGSATQA